MRTLLALSGLCLLLYSCRTKEPDAVGIPRCHIKCSDPQVKLKLPFTGAQLEGMWLIKHSDGGNHHDTVNIPGQQVLTMIPWVDYEIIIPAISTNIIVGSMQFTAMEKDSFCGDECYNAVSQVSVFYNWQLHPCSIVLTGKNEYTITF